MPNAFNDRRRRLLGSASALAGLTKQFIGKYRHRDIAGGIGHNLPQEAPKAFANAVLQVVTL